MRKLLVVALASLAVGGCDLKVANPDVIDASKFNPNTDGFTLSMSAQTYLYRAFQAIVLAGGWISDEIYTGAVRPETIHINSRNFVGTDDDNADFFFPLSLALANNVNAVRTLAAATGSASDSNYARVSMNAGYAFVLMAETMCVSDVQEGPQLTDAQLLDSAVTHFQKAISVGTAAGNTAIVQESQVGLARAYLQLGNWSSAATTAGAVPASFVAYEINSANPATADSLGNAIVFTQLTNQFVVPQLYRHLNDPRVGVDSSSCIISNGLPCVLQTKYVTYGDPIRLASGLEAQFIAAEAQAHGGQTGPALALIATERAKGGQGSYAGGSDTLSVLTELLNQRAREFWLEGKKLGDIRRNPSVPLGSILTDPVGAAYPAPGEATFGKTFCEPIPPEEVNANPNLH